jgi:hypothetical protein
VIPCLVGAPFLNFGNLYLDTKPVVAVRC